jgi:YYY domain-containing protein
MQVMKGMSVIMKKVIYLIIAAVLLLGGKFLLHEDYIFFIQWWLTVFYIGIIFMPVTTLVFYNFHDKGFLFSKVIGIALTGYVMWLLASLHIMKFTTVNCVITIFICLVLNLLVIWLRYKYSKVRHEINLHKFFIGGKLLDTIIAEELVFLGLFILFVYIRGFKPEAYGTEKFMDYGFMTSMLRSEYMPPQDFWYSGTSLNYYYLGQYLATFLTRVSFVKVSIGYNLMLMMVGAFAAVLPYSLVYNIILQYIKDKGKKSRFLPSACGIIGGIAVCIAGNMHYPTYKWFEPLVRRFFGMEKGTYKYWFPDATRFIGYHPETTDKTIHEFPSYSFVLGDLHAHVINIMFVLTVVGILFAWMVSRRKNNNDTRNSLLKEIVNPAIILVSFFIGFFRMTNFWDFPIYYVVSGAVILFTNMVVYNFKGKAILAVTALQGIFVMAVSTIVSLPFILSFDQIASNVCLAVAHTPLNQLIILWGLPVFIVISFICFMITDIKKQHEINPGNEEIQRLERQPLIKRLLRELTVSDLFIIILGLCAAGLVLLPEIIYIQDIYSGEYKRANTMFKLTYQAFILFGVCIGYILLRLMVYGKSWRRIRYSVVGIILFAMTVCYAQNAVNAWYGNIFKPSGYKGLDATAFMNTEMPDDMKAINWLNENVPGMPVVLEANGNSYTDYQRVSVMTGLPTVLGWRTHEWLWKSDEDKVKFRESIVESIYCSTDEGEVRKLLKEYNVSYIYVGKLERDKFTSINEELIQKLGNKVYSSSDSESKNRETYIIQIKP